MSVNDFAFLHFAGRPQITHGLSSVTMATEWTTVTLTCNISSTFAPSVSWERVGGVISPGSSVLLRNETMVIYQ